VSATKNLTATGLFSTAFDQWRIKTKAEQTYAVLMVHFDNANINCLHSQTIAEAGYSAIKTPNDNKENEEGSVKGYHYCWSHGINKTHKGPDCLKKKEGHISEATINNL
jgi:hypothetical protein